MGRENDGPKRRPVMPPSQRAKQFLPFDAVAGLRQALKLKEHEMGLISRKELSEEMSDDINEALMELAPGMQVSVTYFREEQTEEKGEYTVLDGFVKGLDTVRREITLTDGGGEETRIKTDDIISIDLFDRPV